MTVTLEPSFPRELFKASGSDGAQYVVRPFEWSLAKAEKYYRRFEKYRVFSDDIPNTPDGFLAYVGVAGTLWFEALKEGESENVGFMYLTGLQPSWVDKRYLSACFHAITWDAKARHRFPVVKEFIKVVFQLFRLHRLEAAVPLKYGGAIRVLKRLGFREEGVLREARRYNGAWFGVLLLSILESEVS